jgi:hypothetical protein
MTSSVGTDFRTTHFFGEELRCCEPASHVFPGDLGDAQAGASEVEERSMFDAAITALLRAVLDEVCGSISSHETGAKAHVASKIPRPRARPRPKA